MLLPASKSPPKSTGNREGEESITAAPFQGLPGLLQHHESIQQLSPGSGTGCATTYNTEDNAAALLTPSTLGTSPCISRQGNGIFEAHLSEEPGNNQLFEAQGPFSAADATYATSWTLEQPIKLLEFDLFLFRHFVEAVSKLLDLHDPEIHSARIVPHLALRNVGLMKALLALSARHFSLGEGQRGDFSCTPCEKADVENDGDSAVVRSLAAKYYTESLHYLKSAIHHPSHTQSLDLVAAAILISTYEMIDGSTPNWKRRIEGIFWIQQFQDIDGDCKGLRSALWWAWLQQDTWSALLERRRILSIWKPGKEIASLTAPELARYTWYLLGQCVNYTSQEESQVDAVRRADRGSELLHMLKEWREALPPEYNPLPLTSEENVFPAIWVNPASYAAALQIQSLSLVLVVSHHPSLGCIANDRRPNHVLAAAMKIICGIAKSVHADDLAANIVSINCLYEAANFLYDEHEQLALLDLLDLFQQRLRWPERSLRKEVELHYSKNAFDTMVI
ncbi:hypothetical protein N7481_013416 [Penicillium waksmanii]|uniref:uncharacterized protein n=1 Tax=Penicillium waksmanii TaxID=69791 RepID=UPI00254882CE|nr:uncharacterized protein N7481_013416 [Penicillium waksmanii]KAJ5963111.1 hypothetical protein N7481_013416 [Penicillium waksmanii]